MRSPRPKFQNHLIFITFYNIIFVLLNFKVVWPRTIECAIRLTLISKSAQARCEERKSTLFLQYPKILSHIFMQARIDWKNCFDTFFCFVYPLISGIAHQIQNLNSGPEEQCSWRNSFHSKAQKLRYSNKLLNEASPKKWQSTKAK